MTASVTLTKQAAAHRLVRAAVRMDEYGEDPLAVHVTAASALNMLRELVKSQGPGYAERIFSAYFYDAAIAKRQGKPVPSLGPEVDRIVDSVVAEIESGTVTSASNVSTSMPSGEERRLLDHIISPFNFLKHAGKDPLGLIEEGSIQPVEATMHAIAAYALLFPGDDLPPGVAAFVERHAV